MPNIAQLMKDEMARIARKEIRSETSRTKKSSAQHRHDIADLKRRIAALAREVAFLRRQEKKRVAKRPPAELAERARFSSRWVKAHRQKLGLSAANYAKLVGVNPITIYSWEHGRTKPRQQQLASLVTVRKLGRREALKQLEMM